ncbi:uncharacterized protein LOC116845889 isoform X2 [Odontomachus brunneus]|uniref:uncharacterized protein LOC116845889 isoform X2 n=1 Tax=Odontomachus brunneus TaxID=486640 RepID=UPI0013F2802D|nr:uncharacterized protein LOC116845889 isoform X2 [Odontomachus brunneus]
MFSRATKLIVRSLGPRQFYIGKQNFKNFFIGGAGEIGRTQSQLLRNSMKLNTLALYDVTTTNKPLPNRSRIRDYCDNQPLTHIRETKELVEETKELVEALYRLPIAEGVPTLNHSLMSNEIISKAGNACSGLCPHARLLDKIGPNDTRTRQRDCATAIRKCFPGLTCSPFQEYINFIAATRTSWRHLSIKDKGKTGNSPRNVSDAKENNCRSLSPSSLDDEEKPMGGSTRQFNAGKLLNIEINCKMKMSTNRSTSETLLNNKLKWLRDICSCSAGFIGWFPIRTLVSVSNNPISRNNGRFRERLKIDNFENNATAKEKNKIQRVSFGIKSILSDSHVQSRSITISDFYNRGNIPAGNEALSVYDLLSDRILFAPKDCDLKFDIRRKLEKICELWDRLLRRKDRDDICNKRKKACKTTEGTCQKRGEVCQRRTTDCSERRERVCEKQTTVLCSERKSSCDNKDDHDFCNTRKEKCQKQSCTHHKDNDSSRAKVDPCKKHQRAEPVPCKRQESKEATCTKTKEDKCKRSADKDVSCKQREVQKVCQKKKMTREGKKEKDCSDMKKVESRKTRECPPVKRAPGCPEDSGQEEDC